MMSASGEELHDVRLHVNGSVHEVQVPARRLLSDALRDTRPVEREAGSADAIHARAAAALTVLLEEAAAGDLSVKKVLAEVFSGRLWGATALLEGFAAEMRAAISPSAAASWPSGAPSWPRFCARIRVRCTVRSA